MGLINKVVSPLYGIVGDGRLAKHLKYYFTLLNINYYCWDRSVEQKVEVVFKNVDIVLIAISDSAIESFMSANSFLKYKKCVHFSGSLVSEAAYGYHPLMTFSDDLYSEELYKSILFVKDADAPEFSEIFPLLPNTSISMKKSNKAYYHALCVLANNYTTILWQKFFNEMEDKFEAPFISLTPFIEQTMRNIVKNPSKSLTGPLVRNDKKTIVKNLNALENDPFQEIYQSFVNSYKK